MSVRSSILKKLEEETNKKVIKTLIKSASAMFIIWFLNLIGVFVHPQWQMNTGLITISATVLLTVFLIKKSKISNSAAKYIVTMTVVVFVMIITILLSYHAFIIFCFPMLFACMYYDRKLLKITAITSIIILSVAIVLGQFYAGYSDTNFSNMEQLVLFSILPKAVCMWAIYSIIDMICTSIITILGDLMSSEEQKELIKKNATIKETARDVSSELIASIASLERITKLSSSSNNKISDKFSEVYNNIESNIKETKDIDERIQDIVKNINKLDKNIKDIMEALNNNQEENKELMEKIESLSDISKIIELNSESIDKRISNIKENMQGNYEIVEDVAAITQESTESTEFLVDIVESIRELSEQLDTVVN